MDIRQNLWNKRFKMSLICAALIVALPVQGLVAQSIRSEVKVMLERLPLEKQQLLKDFAEEIETYINDHDWTGEPSDEEIPVSIQIFLVDNSVSYEARYGSNFLITNNSDLQYYDRYWRFPHQAGDRLEHIEGVFHPFTGFLDFYINLIIGGEYDKLGRHLGTPFYERAKLISDQAQFNAQFNLGWKERADLIEYILGEENLKFRTMKDIFFLGLSYIGEQDTTAVRYCAESLDLLDEIMNANPDHKEAQQFIEAHHLEFIEVFGDDRNLMMKLIRVDPEREATYREHIR